MKFLSGFLLGGILFAFCAVAFLPVNVISNIRGWVNQSQVEVVQPDTTPDDTQGGNDEQGSNNDDEEIKLPNLGNDNIEM